MSGTSSNVGNEQTMLSEMNKVQCAVCNRLVMRTCVVADKQMHIWVIAHCSPLAVPNNRAIRALPSPACHCAWPCVAATASPAIALPFSHGCGPADPGQDLACSGHEGLPPPEGQPAVGHCHSCRWGLCSCLLPRWLAFCPALCLGGPGGRHLPVAAAAGG